MMAKKLKSYHFDLGNSVDGPVGYCTRIKATSRREALKILKAVLPEEASIRDLLCGTDAQLRAVEYLNVYFSDNVTTGDIDDSEDVKGETDG